MHLLAASHPWWPTLFHWPRALDLVNWWWLSARGYALTSSWFNVAWILGAGALLRSHNCHHHRCPWIGRHHGEHGLLCTKHHVKAGGQIPGRHYQL